MYLSMLNICKFKKKLRLLKVDYATRNAYMRSDTIAESIAGNIGGRVS